MAITDFLKTEHPPEDLAAALRVLRSFKGCEDEREYIGTMFIAWTKLEQLEEFLQHRVEGAPLQPDTLRYIAQEEARAAGRLEEWLQEQKTAKEGPPDAK